jgi:gluconolactonase
MTTRAMPIHIEATGVGFVEGPLVHDDALLFCDLHRGVVKRLRGGETTIVYDAGGVPNGIAIGPDGMLYVANNGGAMRWDQEGDQLVSRGFEDSGFDARIDCVDLANGLISRVFDKVDGRRFQAIDDLVFDPTDGFWFTDLGRDGTRSPTNICFDPNDDSVAYATLARTSQLARIEWDETCLGANEPASPSGDSK